MITAVVAGLVVLVVAGLAQRIVIPWVVSLLRREANVAGGYTTHDTEAQDAARVGDARIRQVGDQIRMTVTRQVNRRGQQQGNHSEFKYRGRIRAGQLIALYHDKSQPHRVGAIVLHLDQQRHCLNGSTMYYDEDLHQVVAFPFFLRKSAS